jgi:hypothetical protein
MDKTAENGSVRSIEIYGSLFFLFSVFKFSSQKCTDVAKIASLESYQGEDEREQRIVICRVSQVVSGNFFTQVDR